MNVYRKQLGVDLQAVSETEFRRLWAKFPRGYYAQQLRSTVEHVICVDPTEWTA